MEIVYRSNCYSSSCAFGSAELNIYILIFFVTILINGLKADKYLETKLHTSMQDIAGPKSLHINTVF